MTDFRAGIRRDIATMLENAREPPVDTVPPMQLAMLVLMVMSFIMLIAVLFCARREGKAASEIPVVKKWERNNIEYV